ncbi:response regulator receiver domain-containing protein [Aliiruegeria haliotis]|uniref:Response regulator receiver domain-containing protein n=1 Tax=Aliiruegeria haliotis TaxID=1280846 RepID=A0A2T0RIW9_9RHOB|nr:response regulator [Aliiruegeria haliotis]PRY21154.1 response regulator receiver domain-containing protein [Aliiruegeria haliotis]
MRVLIVESDRNLGWVWKRHLERQDHDVTLVSGQREAIAALRNIDIDMIILDVVLGEGSALAVSDFASYRHPGAKVIFVTNTTFFSDGSIFQHAPNACAYVQTATPPEDLTVMVEHYGAR